MGSNLQEDAQSSASPEFSVQHLLEQFKISKPTLYKYFDALSIKTTRIGRAAYISETEYDKLRQLILVLQQTKNLPIEEAVQRLRESGVAIAKSTKELKSDAAPQAQKIIRRGGNSLGLTSEEEYALPAPSALQNFLSPANSPTVKGIVKIGRSILNPLLKEINNIAKIMEVGVVAFTKANPLDPLRQHKVLKEAADSEFMLPSSKLAEILELKSLPSGHSFQRIGYQFTKVGRSGRESLWGVSKLSYEVDLTQEQ